MSDKNVFSLDGEDLYGTLRLCDQSVLNRKVSGYASYYNLSYSYKIDVDECNNSYKLLLVYYITS